MRGLVRMLVAGGLALGAAGCGADERADDRAAASLPAADAPEVEAPAVEAPAVEAPVVDVPAVTGTADTEVVNVYWAWSIDSVSAGTPERIAAGGRLVADATPTAAMESLLDGLNDLEAEIGMTTTIPAATELLGVDVAGGVATVDLSGSFNESSGSLVEIVRVAQVVFTLTQFDDIDGVEFRIDGTDVDELGSHGLEATAPLTRDDFENVRAFITLERPYPGEGFASGDRLIGESNVFEGTVEYVVVDGEGRIIAEGFTTASAGSGTWGRFDVSVTFDDPLTELGGVIVWESSPEDGSQQNIVDYPITFAGAVVLPESS